MLTGKSHIVSFLDEELYRCSATAEEGEPGSSRDKIPYRLSNPKELPLVIGCTGNIKRTQ